MFPVLLNGTDDQSVTACEGSISVRRDGLSLLGPSRGVLVRLVGRSWGAGGAGTGMVFSFSAVIVKAWNGEAGATVMAGDRERERRGVAAKAWPTEEGRLTSGERQVLPWKTSGCSREDLEWPRGTTAVTIGKHGRGRCYESVWVVWGCFQSRLTAWNGEAQRLHDRGGGVLHTSISSPSVSLVKVCFLWHVMTFKHFKNDTIQVLMYTAYNIM